MAPKVHDGYVVCPPGNGRGEAEGLAGEKYSLQDHDRISGPEQLQAGKAVYPVGSGRNCQHQFEGFHEQQLAVAVVVKGEHMQQLG